MKKRTISETKEVTDTKIKNFVILSKSKEQLNKKASFSSQISPRELNISKLPKDALIFTCEDFEMKINETKAYMSGT